MSTTITLSACYSLQLPPNERDDRLNLLVRTGLALTLYNSLVMVHGGLTVGLELIDMSIEELTLMFNAKVALPVFKNKAIEPYLLGEFFHLNLLERVWLRVPVADGAPKPAPRLFHEMSAINNCAYIFGGLVLVDGALVPSNDLWRFNLETSEWTCLHDGRGWETDPVIPAPRYNHKLTPINSLPFVGRSNHYGLFIAGGKSSQLTPLFDNHLFDLVNNCYCGDAHLYLRMTTGDPTRDAHYHLDAAAHVDGGGDVNIDYTDLVILSVADEAETHSAPAPLPASTQASVALSHRHHHHHRHHPSILVYTPTKSEVTDAPDVQFNPLISFHLGKHIRHGKPLPLYKRKSGEEGPLLATVGLPPPASINLVLRSGNRTPPGPVGDPTTILQAPPHKQRAVHIPYNLRFPTGGLFGQNLVLAGFLPGEIDILVFIYNRPTGKWLRLNVFCSHDYGLHRFWGGFAWQSHHKVVLIGNQTTLRTTSLIRYFTVMVTISLPVTNLLASSELAKLEQGRLLTTSFTEMPRYGDASEEIRRGLSGRGLGDGDGFSSGGLSHAESVTESDDWSLLSCSSDEERASSESDGVAEPGKTSRRASGADPISFLEYVHYAAPKANFGKIRLVFPPAAITLGRNAFDRYGDMISDFEIVSCQGDRIPVLLRVLTERWGRYFISLLARGYVTAVDRFELERHLEIAQGNTHLRSSKTGSTVLLEKTKLSISTTEDEDPTLAPTQLLHHLTIPVPSQPKAKDVPQFRLPFQDTLPKAASDTQLIGEQPPVPERRELAALALSLLLALHLLALPAQAPVPLEPIPQVPATTLFRSNSRKNLAAEGYQGSPRGSLLHTLTTLRNIPTSKSPRDSPFASPRALVLLQGDLAPGMSLWTNRQRRSHSIDGSDVASPRRWDEKFPLMTSSTPLISSGLDGAPLARTDLTRTDLSLALLGPLKGFYELSSSEQGQELYDEEDPRNPGDNYFANLLLAFDADDDFHLEALLIPRKLYLPFSLASIKLFCEYLYTGQVGNKWPFWPVAMDILCIARFYKVPLLYDLILEVLFGVIGHKELYVLKQAKRIKRKYLKLADETGTAVPLPVFPLDDFDGFIDTIDDGYLDIALLKKNSRVNKRRKSSSWGVPAPPSTRGELISLDEVLMTPVELSFPSLASEAPPSESYTPRQNRALGKQSPDTVSPNTLISLPSGLPESATDEPVSPTTTTGHADDSTMTSRDMSHASAPTTGASTDAPTSPEELPYALDDSDTAQFGLSYLQTNEFAQLGPQNPRSKSVFDQGPAALGLATLGLLEDESAALSQTLESLVSPDSDVPADIVLDIIYEVAVIVMDIKLLLRAKNCREMTRLLRETEETYRPEIDRLKQLKLSQDLAQIRATMQRQDLLLTAGLVDLGVSSNPAAATSEAHLDTSSLTDLKHTPSTTSLFNLSKIKHKSADDRKRLGPFTFKNARSHAAPKDMSKFKAKERAATVTDVDAMLIVSSQLAKKHSLFNLGSKTKTQTFDLAPMNRTASHASSLTSGVQEEKKKKGFFGLKKK